MTFNVVKYEKKDNVVEITICRPEKFNALSFEVLAELDRAFKQVEQDSTIRVVVLKGQGENFAAGADIEMVEKADSPLKVERLAGAGGTVFDRIENCTRPVIAVIKGYCLGGGCELALASDLRIASVEARFGLPEIKLGLIPGAGGTQRLPGLIGVPRAKELLFTGGIISAEEAHRIGLVNKVAAPESLESELVNLVQSLLDKPPLALSLLKSCVSHSVSGNKQNGQAYERRCFATLMYTDDKKEGIKAFKEKRAPKFKGC